MDPLNITLPPPSYYKLYAKGGTHPPPPPVVTGEYSVFGAIENASRAANISHGGSLATFGAAEKFKKRVLEDGTVEIDYETELHTLNHKLVDCYRKLVNSLTDEPALTEGLLKEIEAVGVNMHNLLSRLRPMQARHAIAERMRETIAARKAATARLKEEIAAAKAVLRSSAADLGGLATPEDVKGGAGAGAGSGGAGGAEADAAGDAATAGQTTPHAALLARLSEIPLSTP